MGRRRPRYRLKSKARLVSMLVIIFLLVGGGYLWASGRLNEGILHFLVSPGVGGTAEEDELYEGRKYILLLGLDARKGEEMARTDTMILACVDTEKNQLALLSIPRDTRVNIPKHGMDKINGATLYGGPSLAMEVVSDLLGVQVENYVLTNYEGFKDIIDTLGGVTINVEKRLYHYDPQDGGMYTIDLKPGEQRMDGDKALQYVRYRDYALGDVARTEQQQKFLAALLDELTQTGTILKLPKLLPKINEAISTNLSFTELIQLANTAKKMTAEDAHLITQTLPGSFEEGSTDWIVDKEQAQMAVRKLFEEEQRSQVVLEGNKQTNNGGH